MPSEAMPSGDPAALRRQLMLAQVSLMELEDAREELATRLALLEGTLNEAQALAGTKIAERDHAVKFAVSLEEQSRALQAQLTDAAGRLQQAGARIAELQAALGAAEQLARDRSGRVGELETAARAMKSSRSWRWTAPLRSIERLFGRHS